MSTETTRRALSHEALRAGKARVAYRISARDRHSHATSSSDVPRHVARVERAITFASEGRHAAAERLLRDAAGALARRSAHREEGAALIALGRLLLERGRAGDAKALYRDGGARLPVEDDAGRVSAGLWAIAASIDADRLLEAESRCQKLLKGPMLSPGQRVWAQALLADVFLWQGRVDEAVRLDLPLIEEGEGLDLETVATVNATAVNVLLTAGRVFEAGQRARVGLDRAGTSSSSPRLRLIAETAHLRLLVATGDLALARVTFSRVGDLARTAHAPVRLAHARLIWHEALQRGKAVSEAARELRRLSRARRALPTLLRRVVDQRVAGSTGRGPAAPVCIRFAAEAIPASRLIRLAFEEDDDLAAARLVLDHVVTATRACRVDLRSNPGANRPLLALAGGAPTRAGERTSRWGGAAERNEGGAGYELDVPIKIGDRRLGAIAARWQSADAVPPDALQIFELAAAIIAPRLETHAATACDGETIQTAVPALVGTSSALADVRAAILRAASAPYTVLVEGESGVGKELVARALHQLSPRQHRPFAALNCAALTEELLDAELFGHARGAFTGAVSDRPGLFESADGGTVFLDEVADLSSRAQAKLLRALQQQEARRVGESATRSFDVRLVAAANRDLHEEAAAGLFRRDLLYRIDVLRIRVPPLRARPIDIPPLAACFWRAATARIGSTAVLTPSVLTALTRYAWPGNVRELQNVIAALAVNAPRRGPVRAALLPPRIAVPREPAACSLADARAAADQRCVERALARSGGSRAQAARELGVSRQGLAKLIARLGVSVCSARPPATTSVPL